MKKLLFALTLAIGLVDQAGADSALYQSLTTRLGSPPAIGNVAPNAGKFTSLTATNGAAITGTVSAPLSVTGIQSVIDSGRANNDNTPTINISASEALNYTASYVTHYGLILNATELAGGTGDRIGLASIQTCNATLAGKSCVGGSGVAVAGGSGAGNYTGENPRAVAPSGITGPIGAAVGLESDVETHSPVTIKNGMRIADENQSGGTTTHGSLEDAALAIVNDSGNILQGFNVGIQFGENVQGYPNNWPVLAGGTLIQASNPNVALAYGVDLSGSTAGFTKQAIALPLNTTGGGIRWGAAGTAGQIGSSATTNGGFQVFTDSGIAFNNPSGGAVLNVGGAGGADVTDSGYLTVASLTGYVQCAGASRCTAAPGIAATTIQHSQQEIDTSYVYSTPSTGSTLNFTAGVETLIIDLSGTATSMTVNLSACAAGNDGLIERFSADAAITTLTVTAASGTVKAPPATLAAGAGHAFLCRGANTTWYPLY